MGTLIEVSWTVHPGMLVWPGDEGLELSRVVRMDEGAQYNVSRIACGVHTGTHVDGPFHFIPDGITTERLPLETLISVGA